MKRNCRLYTASDRSTVPESFESAASRRGGSGVPLKSYLSASCGSLMLNAPSSFASLGRRSLPAGPTTSVMEQAGSDAWSLQSGSSSTSTEMLHVPRSRSKDAVLSACGPPTIDASSARFAWDSLAPRARHSRGHEQSEQVTQK